MPSSLASIETLSGRVRRLSGWRKRAAAWVVGAASVLAMAPFFVWPVLWLTLPLLVWLIDAAVFAASHSNARPPRRPALAAAEIGWWFGFGYFFAGLFWIGEAFLVDARQFAALLPFAVTLLPAGLALFFAVAAGAASLFWNTGLYRVLSLALALSLAEWMRGHVLSGFPWNVLGYALTYPVSLMQNAALVGIYGLTLIAILVFAAPAVMWADAAERPAGRRHRMAALAIAIVPLAGMYLFGQLRLALAESAVVPDVKLRIVQPSVPQREKWRPENQERIFIEHLNLSAQAPDGTKDNLSGISHVIWPEAAMPFLPLDYPDVRAAIGRMLGSGKFLLAGALRADPASAGTLRRRIFNSLIVLGEGGSLVALYDKIHLVPFGEYLPVQSALEAIGLQQLTRMRGGFEVGIQPRPLLRVPGLPPAAPLICYEAIFPHAIVGQPGRAGFMLNVTNDGWFGNTTGPRQHFHQARVRTVEEGLPLVRAANNGISAVIDPYGRISARLDLDVHGVIDAALPKPIKPPLYAVWGDGLFFVFCIGCAAILATDRWRNGNLQRMS